jgi:hypothetical protein
MEKKMEKSKDSQLVMDYCAAGETEMMQHHLQQIYSTAGPEDLESVKDQTKWKDNQVPSLWMTQILKSFTPFIRLKCSPVRPMLSNESHYPPRGYPESVWAASALAVEMVAQEVVKSAICDVLNRLRSSPPMWFQDWKKIAEKCVRVCRLACEAQQKECSEICTAFLKLCEKIKDAECLRCVAQEYLRRYFHAWELCYCHLKISVFDILDSLLQFGEDGDDSNWKTDEKTVAKLEMRQVQKKKIGQFFKLKEEFFQLKTKDSPLYQQLILSEKREFLTLEFRVFEAKGEEYITLQKAGEVLTETLTKWKNRPLSMKFAFFNLENFVFDQMDAILKKLITGEQDKKEETLPIKNENEKEGKEVVVEKKLPDNYTKEEEETGHT